MWVGTHCTAVGHRHRQSCIQDYRAGLSGNSLSPKPNFKVSGPWVDRATVPCSAVHALTEQSPKIFPQYPSSTSGSCATGVLLSVGPQYLLLTQQEGLPHDTP